MLEDIDFKMDAGSVRSEISTKLFVIIEYILVVLMVVIVVNGVAVCILEW